MYWCAGELQGNSSAGNSKKGYRCTGVVQGYWGIGVVQVDICTGVVQGC